MWRMTKRTSTLRLTYTNSNSSNLTLISSRYFEVFTARDNRSRVGVETSKSLSNNIIMTGTPTPRKSKEDSFGSLGWCHQQRCPYQGPRRGSRHSKASRKSGHYWRRIRRSECLYSASHQLILKSDLASNVLYFCVWRVWRFQMV